jgi:hypothetical protein
VHLPHRIPTPRDRPTTPNAPAPPHLEHTLLGPLVASIRRRGKQRKAAAGGSPAAAPTAGAAAGPAPTPTAKSANHTAAPSATDTRTSKELLDAVPTTDAARKPDQSDDAPTAAASCASPLAASAKARPAAHAIISKLFEPAVADAAAGGARAPVGDEQEEEEQEEEGAAALGAALGAAFGAEEGGADGGGGGGGGADEDQQVPPLQEPPLDVGLFLDEEVTNWLQTRLLGWLSGGLAVPPGIIPKQSQRHECKHTVQPSRRCCCARPRSPSPPLIWWPRPRASWPKGCTGG